MACSHSMHQHKPHQQAACNDMECRFYVPIKQLEGNLVCGNPIGLARGVCKSILVQYMLQPAQVGQKGIQATRRTTQKPQFVGPDMQG